VCVPVIKLSVYLFMTISHTLYLTLSLPNSSSLPSTLTANTRRTENLRMQMQLDLDETEACHYENIANGLMEKIGRITEERDGLQVLCEQVQREREDLLLSIEGLKMESVGKDEEVRRASELLDDMQDKIAERDRIIVRIKVSCPLLETFTQFLSSAYEHPASVCIIVYPRILLAVPQHLEIHCTSCRIADSKSVCCSIVVFLPYTVY
jgi:hypothetical protein